MHKVQPGLGDMGDHSGEEVKGVDVLLGAGLGALSFSGVDDCVRTLVPAHPLEADRRSDKVASQALYGGPVSQYSYSFSFEAHLFAANDYVVVRSSPRGSSGYGQDFCFALYQGDGEKDYRDVLAAVDRAIELGYSDPDRLGVGGYSYGGILTNYIITQTDRFKGAVSGAGSGLSLANYGHDMYQRWWEAEFGLPWETRELWDRLSPFN
jgi:prolyl oligopeptidase PreP (S9A serine peptidase family)